MSIMPEIFYFGFYNNHPFLFVKTDPKNFLGEFVCLIILISRHRTGRESPCPPITDRRTHRVHASCRDDFYRREVYPADSLVFLVSDLAVWDSEADVSFWLPDSEEGFCDLPA